MGKTFEARFDGKVLVPTGPVDLPTDRAVRLRLEEEPVAVQNPTNASKDRPPQTLAEFADWVDSLPALDRGDLPTDGSINYKHYLYGLPKQELRKRK